MLDLINKIMSALAGDGLPRFRYIVLERFLWLLFPPYLTCRAMCFMCLLFFLVMSSLLRGQINCLRAFHLRAKKKSYFDRMNWCVIMEGVVVVTNLWQTFIKPWLYVYTSINFSFRARAHCDWLCYEGWSTHVWLSVTSVTKLSDEIWQNAKNILFPRVFS